MEILFRKVQKSKVANTSQHPSMYSEGSCTCFVEETGVQGEHLGHCWSYSSAGVDWLHWPIRADDKRLKNTSNEVSYKRISRKFILEAPGRQVRKIQQRKPGQRVKAVQRPFEGTLGTQTCCTWTEKYTLSHGHKAEVMQVLLFRMFKQYTFMNI